MPLAMVGMSNNFSSLTLGFFNNLPKNAQIAFPRRDADENPRTMEEQRMANANLDRLQQHRKYRDANINPKNNAFEQTSSLFEIHGVLYVVNCMQMFTSNHQPKY